LNREAEYLARLGHSSDADFMPNHTLHELEMALR